jgi:hypothetical protein
MTYIYSMFLTKYRTSNDHDHCSDSENNGDIEGHKRDIILPAARADNFKSYLNYIFTLNNFDLMEIILKSLSLSCIYDSYFICKYESDSKQLNCNIDCNEDVDIQELCIKFEYSKYINDILNNAVHKNKISLNECEKLIKYVASKNSLKITADYYWYKLYINKSQDIKCDNI